MKNTETMKYPTTRRAWWGYLATCLDADDLDSQAETTEEKILVLFDEMHSCFSYAEQRGELRNMTDYLQGLGGGIRIPFYNGEVLALVERLGSWLTRPILPGPIAKQTREDHILEGYWSYVAAQLIKIRDWHSRNPGQNPELPEPEPETMSETYKVVRKYQNDNCATETVATGLTREEAQYMCSDPETSSSTCTTPEAKRRTAQYGPWFCGFDTE